MKGVEICRYCGKEIAKDRGVWYDADGDAGCSALENWDQPHQPE